MAGIFDVRVDQGFLRVTGEIPVSSSKEDLEAFVSEIHYMLFGSKKLPKPPSFGLIRKELNEKDAARYIGRSVNFLRKCRMAKYAGDKYFQGPKYKRLSVRNIRYPIEELDKWLASHTKMASNAKYE